MLDTKEKFKGTIRQFFAKANYSKEMTFGKIGGGRLQKELVGGRKTSPRLLEPKDPLRIVSIPIGKKRVQPKARTKGKRGAKSSTVGGIGSQGMKTDSSQYSISNYFCSVKKERPVEIENSPGSSVTSLNTS